MTETNISESDVLPLPYLFRDFAEMPKIEQHALRLAKGKVLDVGCGAGSHSIYLQNKGLDVKAIDISSGAVEVSRFRGASNVEEIGLLDLCDEKYDTILLLMNGTGIFGKLADVSKNLKHLKNLLHDNGQILIDSSDLLYMYDTEENGAIWVPGNHYYGELEFKMSYKENTSDWFPWLYIDENRFQHACELADLQFKVIERGDNYDYLSRISKL